MDRGGFLERIGTSPVAGKAEIWLERGLVTRKLVARATPFRREGFLVNKEPDFIPNGPISSTYETMQVLWSPPGRNWNKRNREQQTFGQA